MRPWIVGAVAAGVALAGSAQAAVPVPRPGCFVVRDAVGDGSVLISVDPAFGPTSDPAVDITGLNLGITPKTVTVYLSLKKLADPLTAGGTLPASYDVRLQGVGGKPVSMWLENFGPGQPARDQVKDIAVPDPGDTHNLRYVRASQGAAVGGAGADPGIPVSVSVTKDLAHSFVAWTFDRATLQRASGIRFERGRLATLGPASTLYNVLDLAGAPADEAGSGLVKIGTTRCV